MGVLVWMLLHILFMKNYLPQTGFALAAAHSMLFVINLAFNGSEEQSEILPKVCSEVDWTMAMSEPMQVRCSRTFHNSKADRRWQMVPKW